ncbi:RNA polymerase subunit sigma-70 [Microbacterium terrisoli]|uniref:RNA polymerase subunit sigma-70 n=1 Tax=Microbacterium terrisoli TaxID=3242192 RepID=UPI0028048E83|nr:RNA polymerase subunit sigma-70 [Microbacterium protaetiae]
MTLVMDDAMTRARAGDGDAFRELTEPHTHELLVHCYRMLGSLQDAEDALQETLLAAWQGLHAFEGRSSLRTWLYRVATNRCLNARRAAGRRHAQEWNVPGLIPPEPSQLGEVVWLEPLPDAVDATAEALGPEARYEQTEAISIAFVRALQLLPPRQLAVLLLRDVLGFHAAEVAGMLGATVESVNSLLKRARSGLRHNRVDIDAEPAPARHSAAERSILTAFVTAYQAGDVDAIVALLTDDAFMSMPPIALEYVGRTAVGAFCAALFGSGRTFELELTGANGQPAFGIYTRTPDGTRVGTGLLVLTLAGDRVSAMDWFEAALLPRFGLPRTMA